MRIYHHNSVDPRRGYFTCTNFFTPEPWCFKRGRKTREEKAEAAAAEKLKRKKKQKVQ